MSIERYTYATIRKINFDSPFYWTFLEIFAEKNSTTNVALMRPNAQLLSRRTRMTWALKTRAKQFAFLAYWGLTYFVFSFERFQELEQIVHERLRTFEPLCLASSSTIFFSKKPICRKNLWGATVDIDAN